MSRLLFKNFLNDTKEYHACQNFWKEVLNEIEQSLGQTGEWKRWIPLGYADGTPFELDGNPIYDGRSDKINRAYRIIQHSSTNDDTEISAWLNSYDEEFTDLPRDELFINLVLSQESVEIAKTLLQKWMFYSTTAGEMQSFIDDKLIND